MTLQVGNRVTRELYMDDGTWQRLGDKCLPKSPLRHGTVIELDRVRSRGMVKVRWDETFEEKWYFEHGVTRA